MRFIDADALYGKLYPLDLVDKRLYTINAKAVEDSIAKIPTADVVPRSEYDAVVSEVERLKKENEKLTINMNAYGLTAKRLKEDVERWRRNLEAVLEERAEEKSEVAREIFEEIENMISPMLGLEDDKEYVAILSTTFAELKKKYTEGDRDGRI